MTPERWQQIDKRQALERDPASGACCWTKPAKAMVH